ncbi:MAG: hypothetical protein M1815_004086 [Lichina confinis]|nr:MAG: hypothetical protein M1815_004086 [Lichina confinis]
MTGYIIDALPEHRCNRLDRLVVRGVRRFLRLKALEEPSDAAARQRKKNREQALQTFVLTLSDQQLVTGLAITLAGWVKCDISTYSFNIVAALAWFSCTTHLSTLTVLHDYFQTHPRLRVWRVLGMVLSVIGLLAAQIATFNGHLSNNTLFYCATAQGFYVELFTDRLDFHRLVIVTIWLSYAFANRLTWLYRKDQTVYSKSIVYRKIMAMLKQPVEAVPMRVHVAERSREVLMRKPLSSFRAKLGSLAATYDLVGEEFGASFLCQISWLAFSLAYGIGQTIVARQQLSHSHGDSSMEGLNVMGFGQIVAIMLLLLPLIMAGEIYQGRLHQAFTHLWTGLH